MRSCPAFTFTASVLFGSESIITCAADSMIRVWAPEVLLQSGVFFCCFSSSSCSDYLIFSSPFLSPLYPDKTWNTPNRSSHKWTGVLFFGLLLTFKKMIFVATLFFLPFFPLSIEATKWPGDRQTNLSGRALWSLRCSELDASPQ